MLPSAAVLPSAAPGHSDAALPSAVLPKLAIIGAAGQARDTAWLVHEINAASPSFEFVGFLVSDQARLGLHDDRHKIIGDFDWLKANVHEVQALAMGIGNPALRLRIGAQLRQEFPELSWPNLIHPRVEIDRATLKLGRGVMIAAGVAGSVNIELDDLALVNIGCTLGHEARIGRGCVINHGASISGGVVLNDGVLVGTGARVLQYLSVGAGSTVGAGAVVTKNVPPGCTVVGVPARPLARKTKSSDSQ